MVWWWLRAYAWMQWGDTSRVCLIYTLSGSEESRSSFVRPSKHSGHKILIPISLNWGNLRWIIGHLCRIFTMYVFCCSCFECSNKYGLCTVRDVWKSDCVERFSRRQFCSMLTGYQSALMLKSHCTCVWYSMRMVFGVVICS